MRSLLCSLINATLCGKQFECSGVSEEEWQRCFDMALQQNTPKNKSSNLRRLYIAERMLKNNWKFKEFADISAMRLLRKGIAGHINKRLRTIRRSSLVDKKHQYQKNSIFAF